MKSFLSRTGSLALVAGLAAPAFCQDDTFNVDIGQNALYPQPSNAYGGASGQAGFWNAVSGTSVGSVALMDINGNAGPVTMTVGGGVADFEFDNANTTGDDQNLMDDLLDLGATIGNVGTVQLTGLPNGDYDVFVYSWAPDNRTGFTTDIEVVNGQAGPQTCGGMDWTGSHVEGATYVRDVVTVTNGTLTFNGIVVGSGNTFGSINGFQVQPAECTGSIVTYCTAKSGLVCNEAMISGVGAPSAAATSGFELRTSPARGNRSGLYIYTDSGRANFPFQGGTLCIQPPLKRTSTTNSGGTQGLCDGVFVLDMNAFASGNTGGNPDPFLLMVGQQVNVQCWGRDSVATGSLLSNGLEYVVCP